MISFIVSRFSLTDSSMLVLPVLSISFINDNGSSTAKGMFFLISSATFGGNLSAYGAEIKKSILSEIEPTVLLIGLEGFLHRCTMRVATIVVSFSALTLMLSALSTDEGSSFRSISSMSGRSRLSS